MRLHEDAPAKLNLYLHLRGKRGDGYHLLDSLVLFLSCGDWLEAEIAPKLSISVSGPFASVVPPDEGNLAMRAAKALQQHCGIRKGAAIHLHKHLPAGAGLGGGSSDAAACLRLLQKLWDAKITPEALHAIAAQLGSDVPACLHREPCYLGGVGEQITPSAPLPLMHMVIIWPGVPLGTAEVYKAYRGGFAVADAHLAAQQGLKAPQFAELLSLRRNDLEKPALGLLHLVGEALEALRNEHGCVLARMTGSGSACFGIFSSASHAHRARMQIVEQHPAWWVEEATNYGETK